VLQKIFGNHITFTGTMYLHCRMNENYWQSCIAEDTCTVIGYCCCTCHRRPFLPRCRWESLEHATTGDHVSLPSLQTFKRALKTELFRRSYNAH